MTTVAELDRQKRWYAAVHTDSLTRRTEAVIRLADEEQAELRRTIEGLRAALVFKSGVIEDLAGDLERAMT